MGEDKIKYLRKKYPHYKAYQYLCGFSGEIPRKDENWEEHEKQLLEKGELVRAPGGYEWKYKRSLIIWQTILWKIKQL